MVVAAHMSAAVAKAAPEDRDPDPACDEDVVVRRVLGEEECSLRLLDVDLCADRQIRAIRLFRDPTGWVPHYTDSGAERSYQPVCLGPSYIPVQTAAL